jgi:hypothetical protein
MRPLLAVELGLAMLAPASPTFADESCGSNPKYWCVGGGGRIEAKATAPIPPTEPISTFTYAYSVPGGIQTHAATGLSDRTTMLLHGLDSIGSASVRYGETVAGGRVAGDLRTGVFGFELEATTGSTGTFAETRLFSAISDVVSFRVPQHYEFLTIDLTLVVSGYARNPSAPTPNWPLIGASFTADNVDFASTQFHSGLTVVAGVGGSFETTISRTFSIPRSSLAPDYWTTNQWLQATVQGFFQHGQGLDADVHMLDGARLTMWVPEDVTYSSRSGVFLVGAAVPEARTSVLMAIGLCGGLLAVRGRPWRSS